MLSETTSARRWSPRSRRPNRAEVDPAALDLIARFGPAILGTARRYSKTPEDAEDAYQRALEILLTKAPSTSEGDLVPWLKTVVKHEAFAIRRQKARAIPTGDDSFAEAAGDHGAPPEERMERYERLSRGAEAMRRLKPQEVRCLLLRAEGYSYKQICQATGFTYTKVNRCLTEGRRSFLERLEGIESGAECERLAPLLSAAADGEATAEGLAALRPHLKSCLTCRATLRQYRDAPARVAALVPPAALVASGPGEAPGVVTRAVESLLAGAQERVASAGVKAHQAIELASAQKVAAVAASTAAVAGGGAATASRIDRDAAPDRDRVARASHRSAAEPPAPPTATSPPPGSASDEALVSAPRPAEPTASARSRERPLARIEPIRREFAPESAQSPEAATAAPTRPPAAPRPPSSAAGSATGRDPAATEFGP